MSTSNPRNRALLAVLAAALMMLLLIATGSAQATTQTEYEVLVEGKASYAQDELLPVINGSWEQHKEASVEWRAQIPSVTFIDKRMATTSRPTITMTKVSGKSHESLPTPTGPKVGDCSGDALFTPPSGTWLEGSTVDDGNPESEDVVLRTIGNLRVVLPTCTGALGAGAELVVIDGNDAPLGQGVFDARFDLPHEAIDMDRIIQLLHGSATGERCPGDDLATIDCSLNWEATVTFVRTGQRRLDPPPEVDPNSDDDGLVIPLPPPPAPKPPADDDDDLIVPLPKGKLSADGSKATLTLSCSVACTGTATAFAPQHGGRASAARPLATARFAGAPGREIAVTLRLPHAGERMLRRTGSVRVAFEVVPRSGGAKISRNVVVSMPRATARGMRRSPSSPERDSNS